jgi:transcriptional regulator with XRE-family HTH domain
LSLGKRIKSLRRASGLTQQQLADRVEVSRIYVQALESGRRTPSMKLLGRLGPALGVEPADLVQEMPRGTGGRMQMEELLATGEVEVWYRSHRLSPKERRMIERLIRATLEEWDEEEPSGTDAPEAASPQP